MLSKKIRVLIVDDSAVVRKLASDALSHDPAIEVVGTAVDPYVARDKILELNPDVLTLDLEMPRMDGLTFLKLLMAQRPMPVIVMSSLTQQGSDYALEALRLGAVDVLAKPGGSYSFGDLSLQLAGKIKIAATARVQTRVPTAAPFAPRPAPPAAAALRPVTASPFAPRPAAPPPPPPLRHPAANDSPGPVRIHAHHPRSIILLGASTGGTEALRAVLTHLPAGLPGIAIVQHIPPVFSKAFADRLNTLCAFEVREAVDGDRLEPGLALVAPGSFHMLLQWQADHYRVRVTGGPPIWHQRPAVDMLFKSAADCGASPHAVAGILTGMGKDGAEGLLRLREKGAVTFAQDEATSVVYGMPRVAWETGAAQNQLPLDRVASYLVSRCGAPESALQPSVAGV
jgi:two-component system chemotaxis response regulator CheB